MTASWVRDQVSRGGPEVADIEEEEDGGDVGRRPLELCSFYESLETEGNNADIPMGVYDLDQLKELGRKRGWCPYFLARRVRALCIGNSLYLALTVRINVTSMLHMLE